jgi:ribosome biogenesis GTPase / thiamine phosphate phosphatase
MKGTVTKSTGSWYTVRTEEGTIWQARTRGKMRLENLDTSNPVAVGDMVTLEPDIHYEQTASILEVLPRKNWVIRKANKLSSKRQILASNLDAAVLVGSIISPRTSLGFIDRFLVGCQAFHVPAIIFLNKSDLLGSQYQEVKEEFHRIYQHAQVDIFLGSALTPGSIQSFKKYTDHKRILLAGHSGVGKSTLMNALYPDFNARVGAISTVHEKGKHTTTFAEMYTTQNGTQIIDTPGIRDFGVVDMPPHELPQYFPEFRRFMKQCKFNNCTHIHEPDCAVLYHLEQAEIPQERYYSYRSILNNEDIFK